MFFVKIKILEFDFFFFSHTASPRDQTRRDDENDSLEDLLKDSKSIRTEKKFARVSLALSVEKFPGRGKSSISQRNKAKDKGSQVLPPTQKYGMKK